jgi:chromosome segregation ATPase
MSFKENLIAKCGELEGIFKELLEYSGKLEKENEELKAGKHNFVITNLQNTIRAQKNDIQALQENARNQKITIDTQQSEIGRLKRDVSIWEGVVKTKNEELKLKNTRISELFIETQTLKSKIVSLENNVPGSNSQYEFIVKSYKNLEDKHRVITTENELFKRANENLGGQLSKLNNQYCKVSNEHDKLKSSLRELMNRPTVAKYNNLKQQYKKELGAKDLLRNVIDEIKGYYSLNTVVERIIKFLQK